MKHYIDGFILTIPRDGLERYKEVVEQVASSWKEHGALDYSEFVDDTSGMQGTVSFSDFADARENEIVIFGWVVFESREACDLANKSVAADPRMTDLINPLVRSSKPIFDAKRMVYGGFRPLLE